MRQVKEIFPKKIQQEPPSLLPGFAVVSYLEMQVVGFR